MDTAKALKTLLKEAEIYQTQGLLSDARKKLETAVQLISDAPDLQHREELAERVQKKIGSLEKVVYRVEKRTVTPEISLTDKELIKKLFSVSEEGDTVSAAIEGAMALAKFGIFERAIQEFELLLDDPEHRLEVAKHILRCHMAIRNAHDPTIQYQKWAAPDGLFSQEELEKLKQFLNKAYGMQAAALPVLPDVSDLSEGGPGPGAAPGTKTPEKKPVVPDYDPYEDSYEDVLDMLPKKAASSPPEGASEAYSNLVDSFMPKPKQKAKAKAKLPDEDDAMDDYIDYVSSVSIPVSIGPRKGQLVEVPVNLQTNDAINLIIASAHKDVVVMMKKGAQIEKLKLNSPISSSTATGTVKAVALIDQGPRQGDYSVDLKVVSTE
jgi:tetratricopeptide (TPR) repeat protein